MFYHTLKLSWLFPLNYSLFEKNDFRKDLRWLQACSRGYTELEELTGGFIRSFGQLKLRKRSLLQIINQYFLIRAKKKIDFPPLFQFATPSKRISFKFKDHSLKNIDLQSVYYRMKCYPMGAIVIDLQFNFNQKPFPKEKSILLNKIAFGQEEESCKALLHFLFTEIITSLFRKKKIREKITRSVTLPKPTIELFMNSDEKLTRVDSKKLAGHLFPALKRNDSSILYGTGYTEEEFIMFHKTGCVFYSPQTYSPENKTQRKNIRRNLDFIMDLTYLTELLLDRFLNRNLEKFLGNYSKIQYYLDNVIINCDHSLVAGFSYRESLLPSAALKAWYKRMSKLRLLKVRHEKALNMLVQKIDCLYAINLADFIHRYQTNYFPKLNEKFSEILEKYNITLQKERSYPTKDKLSDQHKQILKLLEDYALDDLKEFLHASNESKREEIRRRGIGFRKRFDLSKETGLVGRHYSDLIEALDDLMLLNLVIEKPDPNRRNSYYYRIAINHPYLQYKFKKFIVDHKMSEFELMSKF